MSVVRKLFDELDVALSGLTPAPFVGTVARRLSSLTGAFVGALFFAFEQNANLGECEFVKGVVAGVAIPLLVQCGDKFRLIG